MTHFLSPWYFLRSVSSAAGHLGWVRLKNLQMQYSWILSPPGACEFGCVYIRVFVFYLIVCVCVYVCMCICRALFSGGACGVCEKGFVLVKYLNLARRLFTNLLCLHELGHSKYDKENTENIKLLWQNQTIVISWLDWHLPLFCGESGTSFPPIGICIFFWECLGKTLGQELASLFITLQYYHYLLFRFVL